MNIVSQKQKIMTVEEKAKRYAQSVVDESVENYIGDEIYNSHIEYASQCYTAGYTQSVTDLSAENEKLREALSLLVEKIDAPLESPDEWFNDLFDVATEAKQLITEP